MPMGGGGESTGGRGGTEKKPIYPAETQWLKERERTLSKETPVQGSQTREKRRASRGELVTDTPEYWATREKGGIQERVI